jgi:MFS family permease
MLALLARRPLFRRLYLAGAISQIGDWLSLVAVSLVAVQGESGPWSLALVFAAHALPAAVGSTIAGPLADRFDRRNVLLVAHLGQGALTLLMALAASRGSVGLLSLLVLVRSAAASLVVPAETAALRRVVEHDELSRANALIAATWSVSFVLGMALGGGLAMLGPVVAILLDAVSFAIASVLVRGLPAMPVDRSLDPVTSGTAALLAAPADMVAALRHASSDAALLYAVLAKAPLALGAGAAWVALNLVSASAHPFGTAAFGLGVLQAIRGAGTGLGPALGQAMMARGARAGALGHGAAAASLGAMGALVHVDGAVALALTVLIWGMGSGTNWVLASTALQQRAPDAMIGRLASLDELIATALMVASALAAGALVTAGVSSSVVVTTLAAAGGVAWVVLSARSAPRSAVVPARQWY